MSDETDKGFVVNDRRGEDSSDQAAVDETPSEIPINFASFVLSLSTSALMHLGELEAPEGVDKPPTDLRMAQHEIAIIEMLNEKTSGNQTNDEQQLLSEILFHLRMKYVEKTKA